MSKTEDIPDPPPLLDLYSWIRNKLSPRHTSTYLFIEGIIMGILITLFSVYTYSYSILYLSLIFIPFILIPLVRWSLLEPENRNKGHYVMNIDSSTLILVVIVSILPLVGFGYMIDFDRAFQVLIAFTITYVGTIFARSQKYSGERHYYTDHYSKASEKWYRASVALEQALKHADKGNKYSAYFWASKAENQYESIVETEERVMLRQAASAFSAGCRFLSVAIFTKNKRSYSFQRAAQQSFERAGEFLSQRVCDNCGRKDVIDNCNITIEENSKTVFCGQCYRTKQNNRQQRKHKEGYRKRKQRKKESSGKQKKKRQKRQKQQDKDRISVEKALKVLELSKPIDSKDEIHKAFRKQVKTAHPDVGGSEEEFKRVKRAREVLLDEVN